MGYDDRGAVLDRIGRDQRTGLSLENGAHLRERTSAKTRNRYPFEFKLGHSQPFPKRAKRLRVF